MAAVLAIALDGIGARFLRRTVWIELEDLAIGGRTQELLDVRRELRGKRLHDHRPGADPAEVEALLVAGHRARFALQDLSLRVETLYAEAQGVVDVEDVPGREVQGCFVSRV